MQQQLIINNNNATMIHLFVMKSYIIDTATTTLSHMSSNQWTSHPICVRLSCLNPTVSNTNATSHWTPLSFRSSSHSIIPFHSFLSFPFLSFPFFSWWSSDHWNKTIESCVMHFVVIIIIIINNATIINNMMQFLCYI